MTQMAVLHGRWSRDADYRGAYAALGEEFDRARSLSDARPAVRLAKPPCAKRQKTPRQGCRESTRKRSSTD